MIKHPRQKGNRLVREVVDVFERAGCEVGRVERTGKYVRQKDLFGLFDLVAINYYGVFFVQVTSSRAHSHKPFLKFKKEHPFVKVYQFVRLKGKVWKIFDYGSDGKVSKSKGRFGKKFFYKEVV